MVLRRLLPWFILPVVLAGTAIEPTAEIELSGVLSGPEKTTVHLTKRSTGYSGWVAVGQTFADYTVASYDPKTETVTLTKNGVPTPVQLNTASIKEIPAAVFDEEQRKRIVSNLRQIAAAFDQYQQETGKKEATFSDLVGPDKYIKNLVSVDGEDYSKLTFASGNTSFTITTASGATVVYDRK